MIGKQQLRRCTQTWFDNECEEITKKKNAAYMRMQQVRRTRHAEKEYRNLRREEKRIHKKKKKEHMERKMLELEEINTQSEVRKFYQKINRSRKEFKPRITICRAKDGNILSDKESILKMGGEL